MLSGESIPSSLDFIGEGLPSQPESADSRGRGSFTRPLKPDGQIQFSQGYCLMDLLKALCGLIARDPRTPSAYFSYPGVLAIQRGLWQRASL